MEITSILRSIGLTPGESRVYTALLGLGTSRTGEIVDKSGVSASKVYNILERLVKKGLVSTVTAQKTKQYRAADPTILIEYLTAEQTRIENQKKDLAVALPLIEALKGKTEKLPIVEVIGGKRGYDLLYQEILRDATPESLNRIIVSEQLSFLLQDRWFEYTKIAAQKGLFVQSLYNNLTWFKKDPQIHRRSERPNYFPLLLEIDDKLPSISIAGSKTLISGFDESNQLFSLIIRNELLTKEFIRVFDILAKNAITPQGFKTFDSNKDNHEKKKLQKRV